MSSLIKRLTSFSAIEITTDEVTIDMNVAPLLYLYNFGSNYQFMRADSETENRNNSFSTALLNKQLTTIPDFYPDSISADYHNQHEISVLYGASLPVMQYKKVRLLLVNGFGYSDAINALTLRISHQKQDNTHVDLLSYVDYIDNSNISALEYNVYHNGITYSQGIEFLIPDIDYMYDSTDSTIISMRNDTFGTSKPNILKVSTTSLTGDKIDLISRSLLFTYSDVITQSIETVSLDSEIGLTITEQTSNIKIGLVHNLNYDLGAVIKAKLNASSDTIVDIVYTITVEYIDNLIASLGTYTTTLSNVDNKYDPILFVPNIIDNCVNIVLYVSCRMVNVQNGFTLTKTTQKTIVNGGITYKIDSEPKQLSLDTNTLNLVQTQNITKVVHTKDAPKIIYVNKIVYAELIKDTLDIYDKGISIKFDKVQSLFNTLLVIGDLELVSIDGVVINLSTSQASYIRSNKFSTYSLYNTIDNTLIASGNLSFK